MSRRFFKFFRIVNYANFSLNLKTQAGDQRAGTVDNRGDSVITYGGPVQLHTESRSSLPSNTITIFSAASPTLL